MKLPSYQVSYSRAQDSHVRVLLNDVPICAGKSLEYAITQETANALVVPGKNLFSIEMAKCKWLPGEFMLKVWRDPVPGEPLLDFSWGAAAPAAPGVEKLPQVFSATFEADDVTHVPCFRRAGPADFGCDGTEEQIDLIMRLYRTVTWKQTDEWLELMQLQHSELYAANHRDPGYHPSTQRADVAEFFAAETTLRPLDPKELHFERRAEGRVALVTRIDGGPPIDAFAHEPDAMGFTSQFAPDLRMTRLDGRWQFF